MKTTAKENLTQIRDLLKDIDDENFGRKADILSGSSIGQHVRHILEFYLLLVSGSFSGAISYDKRQRDTRIENDRHFAISMIDRLIQGIDTLDENLSVKFEGDFTADGSAQKIIYSSVGRELAYCIEHSIHHQALIKAGLIAFGLKELTGDHFGVAYSTIRFRENKCAQ